MAIDFALTPTGDADVAGSFSGLLKARPNTTLLDPGEDSRSIKSFVARADLEAPGESIDNLILTSHAAPSGILALQLVDGGSADLNYDTFEKALQDNQNVVRASATLVSRAEPNAGIIVKGCDLGRSPEFMALLQAAIGKATFGIIASLYAHCAGHDPKNGGWIEFMQYEFQQDYFLSKDNTFDKLDPVKLRTLTRGKLIADMKANPHNRRFDGSSFPDAAWQAMIPRLPALNANKIPKPTRKQFTAKFPPDWKLKPFPLQEVEGDKLLDIERFEVVNVQQTSWDVADIGGGPPPKKESPIAVRRAFMRAQLATDRRYQASHPYPVYKRHGFASLDEFVNHFDWGSNDGTTWVAKTWRFLKAIPVTDPATGTLICNRYTSTSRQEALLETNGLLFAAIPASP